MKKSIGLIAALISIIAGGIAIYQFWYSSEGQETIPQTQLSLMEKMEGAYSLQSWVPINRKIALGVAVNSGKLTVSSDGTFDWSAEISQTNIPKPGKVRMTARGKFLKSTMTVNGLEGSKYNNTTHLDSHWGQVSPAVGLAIRGWSSGKSEDPFQVSIDERSNGDILLDMKNSKGIFTWKK